MPEAAFDKLFCTFSLQPMRVGHFREHRAITDKEILRRVSVSIFKIHPHDTAPLINVSNVSAIFSSSSFALLPYIPPTSLHYYCRLPLWQSALCCFAIEMLFRNRISLGKKNWNFQQKNAFFTMVQRKYKLHPHLHLKVSIAQKDCQFFPAR